MELPGAGHRGPALPTVWQLRVDRWSSIAELARQLVDVTLPLTARGHLYVAAFGGFLRLKRLVKQTPWLWQGFTRLRSRLGASSSGAGDLPKRGTA